MWRVGWLAFVGLLVLFGLVVVITCLRRVVCVMAMMVVCLLCGFGVLVCIGCLLRGIVRLIMIGAWFLFAFCDCLLVVLDCLWVGYDGCFRLVWWVLTLLCCVGACIAGNSILVALVVCLAVYLLRACCLRVEVCLLWFVLIASLVNCWVCGVLAYWCCRVVLVVLLRFGLVYLIVLYLVVLMTCWVVLLR